MPGRKLPDGPITWQVVFSETSVYSLQQRSQLFRLLKAAAPPGASEALLQRGLYELDHAARDQIKKHSCFRDGKLDTRLETAKTLRNLEKLVSEAVPILQRPDVQRALIEEGNGSLSRTEQVLTSLARRCGYSAHWHEQTPRGIGQEGKRLLEDTLLNDFLVIASIAWHHATGDRPKPHKDAQGGPGGPYAKFLLIAIAPLLCEINAGFIDTRWSAIRDRLRKTIRIREIPLLNPKQPE